MVPIQNYSNGHDWNDIHDILHFQANTFLSRREAKDSTAQKGPPEPVVGVFDEILSVRPCRIHLNSPNCTTNFSWVSWDVQ